MIGKITIGKSFRACIQYCLEDKVNRQTQEIAFKNRAEVLLFHQCFGNKQELVQQFNEVSALNQRINKPVLHITLSLSPGEQLSKAQLTDLVEQCARDMGFQDHQYLAIHHIDTDHQHLHLVANRIGYNGKVVRDGNNYKKIAQYCRKMELRYGLRQVLSPRCYLSEEQRQIPRQDIRKMALREDLYPCLLMAKNFSELEQLIQHKGYRVERGRGIAFIDNKGVRIKGSEVGYPLWKIEKILEVKQQLQQQQEVKQRHPLHLSRSLDSIKDLYKDLEQHLSKALNLLLKPAQTDDHIPYHLTQKHESGKQKKRKRKHWSQHL